MIFGKLVMSDGTEATIELWSAKSRKGALSGEGKTENLIIGNFEDIMKLIKTTAENAYLGFQNINEKSRPKEYELTFGLKLNSDASIIFARAGWEGNFQVTLRWDKT